MLAFQARAMLRGLAKLGGPSVLAGIPCGFAAIERDVEVYAGIGNTADDNSIVTRTVAAVAHMQVVGGAVVPVAYPVQVGLTLVHPEGSFVLDRLLTDNGVVRRFIVVAAS